MSRDFLQITPGFWLILGVNCYLFGFAVVAAFLLASVLHELGHLTMARLLGISICRLRLTVVGGELILDDSQTSSFYQDVLLSLAGPAANFVTLAALLTLRPDGAGTMGAYLISASFLLAVFNLLPILPLDGGCALYALLSLACAQCTADRWMRCLSAAAAVSTLLAGIWLFCLPGRSVSLLILGSWLTVVTLCRK